MALHLGTGRIETRGSIKLPKLQSTVDSVLVELGYECTYEGKGPPEDEEPPDPAEVASIQLLDNGDGVLGVELTEVRVVRDLARLVSERTKIPFLVLMTEGSLFGRRSVEVTCRKFEVNGAEEEELPVMVTHTAEVTDVEHNELRQAPTALRQRIDGANESLVTTEGSAGFVAKKYLRYKRVAKPELKNPRLSRLMQRIERCESFEIVAEKDQFVVKLLMNGAKSMSYLKPDEVAELEQALEVRPELALRRSDAKAD